MNTAAWIVSTDLDGTLLDHHTYAFDAALPALARCRELAVPVILNTSKTLAEVSALQHELGLTAPLITENGSALTVQGTGFSVAADAHFSPTVVEEAGNTTFVFGAPRADILRFIAQVRQDTDWQFEGFADWSAAQIAEHTGLSESQAQQAAQKHYSEPFIWQSSDDDLARFSSLAHAAGLALLKGGRFYHLQGQTDKAKPLMWLRHQAQLLWPDSDSNHAPKLVCLGDNHNDVAMLNVADVPVCVRSPVADYPPLTTDRPVFYTQGYGPVGWNEALQQILTN